MDIGNFVQITEQPWLFVSAMITSIFPAFIAWHKFFQDYWRKRKLQFYAFLISTKPENEEEVDAINQMAEEERFLLTFGRPSIPIIRKLVWEAYKLGLFSHGHFLLARSYFDVSDDGKLEVKFGALERITLFLYFMAFITITLSLFFFTYYLFIVKGAQEPLKIIVLFIYYIPAMLFFLREMVGLAIAKQIDIKIKKHYKRE